MSLSWRSILPLLLSLLFLPTVTFAGTQKASFASPEHVFAGNKVKLRFLAADSGQDGTILTLQNGLKLTYGELIAMPDFYSLVDEAISLGSTDAKRRRRFMDAFNSLAVNPDAATEAIIINEIMQNEQKTIDEGMKNGKTPEEVYKEIGDDFDRQYNCQTGGGCDKNVWWMTPGRYLSLVNSKSNYDHFGDNAVMTYIVGHQLALEKAVLAHQKNDLNILNTAYAINAFACHFLTDRFASGHIRTPRVELSEQSTPFSAGSLLANYMHNEENEYGLHVTNLRGDHWVAYGDKSYFNPKSNTHATIMHEALQQSADAIFLAFLLGTTQVNDHALELIPLAEETASSSKQDISPLFYWDSRSKKLMRRKDMTNYYDRHWSANWWAWLTLVELKSARGLANELQASLALSDAREQALQSGLITNKDIIQYINTH